MQLAIKPLFPDHAAGRPSRSKIERGVAVNTSDRQFFEESVTRLMERLYGAAMRFTRNSADAEDLLAESLEKAWNSLPKLEDKEKFDGWMMRIVSNTYISNWRRNQVHDKVFDESIECGDLDDTHSLYARLHQPFLLWWGTPEQTFLNNLLKQDIDRAIDALSDEYRIVVLAVQILGYSYEEAADSLGVPIGTIRSRLNRGRQQLQDALWHHAKEAETNSAQ